MAEFGTDVRTRDATAVIDLHGDLDGRAADELHRAYGEAAEAGPQAVVLNFADVGYINSTGIALIVGLLAQARAGAIDIRAIGLSEHYRHVFEITRLSDFMTYFPTEDEAVGDGMTTTA